MDLSYWISSRNRFLHSAFCILQRHRLSGLRTISDTTSSLTFLRSSGSSCVRYISVPYDEAHARKISGPNATSRSLSLLRKAHMPRFTTVDRRLSNWGRSALMRATVLPSVCRCRLPTQCLLLGFTRFCDSVAMIPLAGAYKLLQLCQHHRWCHRKQVMRTQMFAF